MWVAVEVHTFLKDGLKDILLEQSAHMLSDMTLKCIMGINGRFMGLSVCMQRVCALEARPGLKLTLSVRAGKKGMDANGTFVASGVETWIQLYLICTVSHLSHICLKPA